MAESLHVVVVGGGLHGLASALLLARDGHRVTVLERDPAEPPAPERAWVEWGRHGLVQFRLPHFLLARCRQLLESELPDVAAAIEAAGLRFDLIGRLPGAITGGVRDGDERFVSITARRPVFEAAIARVAAAEPGVEVRRGVGVRGLLTGDPDLTGVPNVSGVVTDGGETLPADLVVDAGGRRSSVPALLSAIGATVQQEDAEAGFVYFARHLRAPGGAPAMHTGIAQTYDSISVLTMPQDDDTWSIAIVGSSRDKALRAVRDPARFTAVLKRYPAAADWVDAEPISGIEVMGGLGDRIRHFVVDGRPVVTGLVAIGDAWAYTNPTLGRGVPMGLLHAILVRDLLREGSGRQATDLALRWAEGAATVVEPWYRATRLADAGRLAEIEGDRQGVPYSPDDPKWRMGKALLLGMFHDPEVLRAYCEIGAMLTSPEEVLGRPGLAERVLAAGGSGPRYPLPGPDRTELLAVLGSVPE